VIDDAYHASRDGPLERTTLHKLALAYLVVTGFAGSGHVQVIWKMLGHEDSFARPSDRQAFYGPVFYGIRERIQKRKRLD
jgi:hypothetical protein